MHTTDNFKKHTHQNPIQQILLKFFFWQFLRLAQKTNPQSVLDVGCGEGFTLQKLKDRSIGKILEGIEFLQEAIDIGKKIHPEISIKKGTIYQLPYKDNSFDLVICTEVLEHLEEPEKALLELQRVTKQYCLLSVPNEPFFMIGNFIRGKNWSRWGNDIEHINHWTWNGFRKFVSKKFRILQTRIPFFWTIILAKKE